MCAAIADWTRWRANRRTAERNVPMTERVALLRGVGQALCTPRPTDELGPTRNGFALPG